MNPLLKSIICAGLLVISALTTYANGSDTFRDTTRAYAVPTLVKTPTGSVALSWTEKDKAGVVYFYWAESTDKGRTFGDKKLIYSAAGIGSSRLMRPKLLFKKDGSLVSVFTMPGSPASTPTPAPTHANHEAATAARTWRSDGCRSNGWRSRTRWGETKDRWPGQRDSAGGWSPLRFADRLQPVERRGHYLEPARSRPCRPDAEHGSWFLRCH